LRSDHLGQSVAMLQKDYQEAFPGNAFEFFYLDDHFQRQYESDERVADLFSCFALVAISIACLGLLGLAILLASPLAWYAMTWWLQDFAYKTDIKLWTFLVAGVLAIGIALVTVSFQSVKAALMNPVKSLRSE